MKIAVMRFELWIDDADSLKDKRRVVRSVKDKLRRAHGASVAEIEAQDIRNLAVLGVSMVSSSAPVLARAMDLVVKHLGSRTDARLGELTRRVVDDDTDSELSEDELWTEAERRDAPEGAA